MALASPTTVRSSRRLFRAFGCNGPRLRARWDDVATAAPRVTLARLVRGRRQERTLGPRALLSLDGAAIVLDRPVASVRRAIAAGFLRAARRRPRVLVTVRACRVFLDEERTAGERALGAAQEMRRTGVKSIPADEVFREVGLE